MSRRVVITGLGPVSGLGMGIEPTWQAAVEGRSAIERIRAFDPSGFECQIASELSPDFSVRDFVPKTYRKATKVMARDIELAVAAADLAARDANLRTKGTEEGAGKDDEFQGSYPSSRMGAHIGAGLIAADLNELTAALSEACNEDGCFNLHKWGSEGMTKLTPLWLLKYLPNMLACHVTIIHDAQGPSNTITCGEASGLLSIGESLRVLQRGQADLCFCGGGDSKLNPMGYLRQHYAGLLNTTSNDRPATAVRPFDQHAAGNVCAEGGGIVVLENFEAFEHRNQSDTGARIYAEVVGFGASQTVNREKRNLQPDAEGRGFALAIGRALRAAQIEPDQVDLIVPFGIAVPAFDQAEANAYQTIFGDHLNNIAIAPFKAIVGQCAAGVGGLDTAIAAKALAEQTVPAVVNCDNPLDGLPLRTAPSRKAELRYALVVSTSVGGQNGALLLKRFEG